jgi:hypothetical protein
VEARIRTVVERAVTPLIPVSVYNPETRQLDKVSPTERACRIEAVVREALASYGVNPAQSEKPFNAEEARKKYNY